MVSLIIWGPPESGLVVDWAGLHKACNGTWVQARLTERGKPPIGVTVRVRTWKRSGGIVSEVEEAVRLKSYAVMSSATGGDVEGAKLPVGLRVAVIWWVPADRVEMDKEAPAAVRDETPRTPFWSEKVMTPVGVWPEAVAVATIVTDCPSAAGFGEAVKASVVAIAVMVSLMVALEGSKLPEPL